METGKIHLHMSSTGPGTLRQILVDFALLLPALSCPHAMWACMGQHGGRI